MLNEKETRALLVARLLQADGQCNSHYLNHVEGQLRALVAVLTGKSPPSSRVTATELLEAVEIPCKLIADEVEFDEQWMLEHGFVEEGDEWTHPVFSRQTW